MNNEQMVSVPREWAELLVEAGAGEAITSIELGVLKHALAQPAAKHQGQPIMLTAVGELQEDGEGGLEVQWLLEGGTAELEHGMLLLVAENNELCGEDGRAEVHTHADAGEVERLRNENDSIRLQAGGMQMEIDELRAQLAERDALLRDTKVMLTSELSYELFARMASHIKRIDAALSASAEPSAPVEVLAQADGVLTFMRSEGDGEHKCVCCDGVHVFCRYFEGMPGFNDLSQAARHRNDLEGRKFRVVLQLLPARAALERKS
ncbi:hypothetical protein D3C77_48950 [compost metagenome]